MRSKQMDALRKRMASGGDPFVTDQFRSDTLITVV